jgi:rhodanese-related sulfurtransferase
MKKTIFITSILVASFIQSCGSKTTVKKEISEKEALELSKKEVLFVDVRSKEEVAEMAYNVKNIINIPLNEIEQNLDKLPKDKQFVLVCKSGVRSGKAYDLLKEKGYTNISAMNGGMNEWSSLKYPVKTGKACCVDPTSSNCNPDGTCKPKAEKACCADPSSEKCNSDGTCKTEEKCTDTEKKECKAKGKSCCEAKK